MNFLNKSDKFLAWQAIRDSLINPYITIAAFRPRRWNVHRVIGFLLAQHQWQGLPSLLCLEFVKKVISLRL